MARRRAEVWVTRRIVQVTVNDVVHFEIEVVFR
jgi:hypothetical protein